jgi:hypothetical protein
LTLDDASDQLYGSGLDEFVAGRPRTFPLPGATMQPPPNPAKS